MFVWVPTDIFTAIFKNCWYFNDFFFFLVHLLLLLDFAEKDINPAFMTSQFVAMEFTMLSQTPCCDYMTASNQRIKSFPV